MADQNESAELLLDVKVAEASRLYKLYLNQEKKILGGVAVAVFLIIWELVGNTFQWINPMFMSAPSLVWSAAVQLFSSGEIFNDLYISPDIARPLLRYRSGSSSNNSLQCSEQK